MTASLDGLLGPDAEPGQYLVADVGPVHLGFDVADVVEVFPIARASRVPWAPPWVTGAVYRHGRVVTLLDAAGFLAIEGDCTPTVAVLLTLPDQTLALIARSVAVEDARQTSRVSDVRLFVRASDWVRASLSTPTYDFHLMDVAALTQAVAEAI